MISCICYNKLTYWPWNIFIRSMLSEQHKFWVSSCCQVCIPVQYLDYINKNNESSTQYETTCFNVTKEKQFPTDISSYFSLSLIKWKATNAQAALKLPYTDSSAPEHNKTWEWMKQWLPHILPFAESVNAARANRTEGANVWWKAAYFLFCLKLFLTAHTSVHRQHSCCFTSQ